MPKRKGPNSEAMIQAAAEGGRLAQAAHEGRAAAESRSVEQLNDVGKQLVGIGERQKDRDTQKEEAEKDRKLRSDEALKDRVSRSGDQARELRSREALTREELKQKKELGEAELQERAAEHGLEQTPDDEAGGAPGATPPGGAPPGATPPGGALDARAQKVQEGMAQGLADQQAKAQGQEHQAKGIEATKHGYRPSAEEMAKRDLAAKTKQIDYENKVASLRLKRQQLIDQHQEAVAKGDEIALKHIKENFEAPLKADVKLRDDIGSGKLTSDDARWPSIIESIEDPVVGPPPDQALLDEIHNHGKGGPYPNLMRYVTSRQMMGAIKMALDTGDLPDGKYWDKNTVIAKRFDAAWDQAHAFMAGGALNNFVDFKSTLHKNRLVNQAAALIVTLQPMLGSMAGAAVVGSSMLPGAAGMAAQRGLVGASQQGMAQQGGPGVQSQPGAPAPNQQQQPAAARPKQQSVGQRVEQYGFSGGGPR